MARLTRIKAFFALCERRIHAFVVSPWSSAALWLFGAVWVGIEASRGKWIGFDGAITLALGEVALATLRKK